MPTSSSAATRTAGNNREKINPRAKTARVPGFAFASSWQEGVSETGTGSGTYGTADRRCLSSGRGALNPGLPEPRSGFYSQK